MKVKHGFKPIYNNKSKILILGTIPSIKSRANKFYYSNPTNCFFKIMESFFNTKLLK
jgi:double-stranded uracil-DNA glycosylase